MSSLHRCPRCNTGACWFDHEDRAVTAVCMVCGERRPIRDGRAEAAEARPAAVRGHMKPGAKPNAGGG